MAALPQIQEVSDQTLKYEEACHELINARAPLGLDRWLSEEGSSPPTKTAPHNMTVNVMQSILRPKGDIKGAPEVGITK